MNLNPLFTEEDADRYLMRREGELPITRIILSAGIEKTLIAPSGSGMLRECLETGNGDGLLYALEQSETYGGIQ